VNERIAIITHRKKDKKGEYQFINEEVVVNPLIVSKSDALRESAEGCLSLPGIEGNVMRHQEVKISYQNLKGEFKTAKLKEFDAAIIQHEIDHLNGVLFVDKME
jgi:peptide deformylase